MFGNVTALVGLHVTGKYRDESMMHTCSRLAAWVPHKCGIARPAPLHHRPSAGFSFRGGGGSCIKQGRAGIPWAMQAGAFPAQAASNDY